MYICVMYSLNCIDICCCFWAVIKMNTFRWETKRQWEKGNKNKNRKGYQPFLFILRNTQEVESERRKGDAEIFCKSGKVICTMYVLLITSHWILLHLKHCSCNIYAEPYLNCMLWKRASAAHIGEACRPLHCKHALGILTLLPHAGWRWRQHTLLHSHFLINIKESF